MQLTQILRSRGNNFFDVVGKLQSKGIGQKIQRKTWGPDSYWDVERVQISLDGRHGKAFGLLTWNGQASEKSRKINGVLKRVWQQLEQPTGLASYIETKKPRLRQKPVAEAEVENAIA